MFYDISISQIPMLAIQMFHTHTLGQTVYMKSNAVYDRLENGVPFKTVVHSNPAVGLKTENGLVVAVADVGHDHVTLHRMGKVSEADVDRLKASLEVALKTTWPLNRPQPHTHPTSAH